MRSQRAEHAHPFDGLERRHVVRAPWADRPGGTRIEDAGRHVGLFEVHADREEMEPDVVAHVEDEQAVDSERAVHDTVEELLAARPPEPPLPPALTEEKRAVTPPHTAPGLELTGRPSGLAAPWGREAVGAGLA